MKEDENILESAINAIRNEQFPPGPSQELVDATVTKLSEAQEMSDKMTSDRAVGLFDRIGAIRCIARYAAAAVLLIVAGYAVGRLSAPRQPNIQELQDTLEPTIRQNVVAQLKKDLQSGLKTCYDQLSDELNRQQRKDMAQFAAQTLSASNSNTSRLVIELIESINTLQTEQRQRFTAALEQMELEHQYDTKALAQYAVQTEDKLQSIAQFLSYGLNEGYDVNKIENSENHDERTDK